MYGTAFILVLNIVISSAPTTDAFNSREFSIKRRITYNYMIHICRADWFLFATLTAGAGPGI
jgi:hypothetical protein